MATSEMDTYQQLLESQRQRVADLRAAGEVVRAKALAADYHAEQMLGLTQDGYSSAAKEGKPPTGYLRGSEHLELLQAKMPGMSLSEIKELLQPRESGFRAEIYLPDNSVLGNDAKPVLVFKGTSGKIHDGNGARDTAVEDWLTANLPQGMGLRTDYYDRAMDLATILKDKLKGEFEIAGHSLGGGMASAASAVTGMHATTINSAGLHPQTAARYASENPGVQLYAAKGRVDAYNVAGDVLTDVQTGVNRMPPGVQKQVNALLSDAVDLLQTPGLRKTVEDALNKQLPAHAREPAKEVLDYLVSKPGRQALKEMPVAVGDLHSTLQPKTVSSGKIIDREEKMALSQVAEFAGPVISVLETSVRSAQMGRMGGRIVQGMGNATSYAVTSNGKGAELILKTTGQTFSSAQQLACEVVKVAAQSGGEFSAQMRLRLGKAESFADRAVGQTQQKIAHGFADALDKVGLGDLLSSKTIRANANIAAQRGEEAANRAANHAARDGNLLRHSAMLFSATYCLQSKAIAKAQLDTSYHAADYVARVTTQVGGAVKTFSDKAPAVGTVIGATQGLVGGAFNTFTPDSVEDVVNLNKTKRLTEAVLSGALGEALNRHGVDKTALPSLRSSIRQQEKEADTLIEASQQSKAADQKHQSVTSQDKATRLDDTRHPQNGLFRSSQGMVYALDKSFGRTPDQSSDQLAGSVAAKAHQAGMKEVLHLGLSADRHSVVAVDTADMRDFNRKTAVVDIVTGMRQSLEVSTQQVAATNQQASTRGDDLQQQATIRDTSRGVASLMI